MMHLRNVQAYYLKKYLSLRKNDTIDVLGERIRLHELMIPSRSSSQIQSCLQTRSILSNNADKATLNSQQSDTYQHYLFSIDSILIKSFCFSMAEPKQLSQIINDLLKRILNFQLFQLAQTDNDKIRFYQDEINKCTNCKTIIIYFITMGNYRLERIAMDVRTHQNILYSSGEIDCKMAVFLKYAEANEISTSHIKMVSLSSKAVSLSGIRTLVRFDLRGTVKLILQNNNFGPYAIKELSKGIFTNLKSIFLRSNKIGSLGLRFLSTGSFSSLQIINLCTIIDISRENEIGSEGMKYLSQGQFKNLDTLQLKQNKIDSEGIKYLSSGVFYRLRVINLSQNRVKSECLKYVLNGSLCKLQKIQLHFSQIFQKTIAIVEHYTFARVQTYPKLKWYK